MNRKCDACVDGTYALQDNNLFGCTECACDIGGSINNLCNKVNNLTTMVKDLNKENGLKCG